MEYQHHQHFYTKVAQELSAFTPSNLWHRSIFQVAEAEPFILDAIIAIGGIHKIINELSCMRDTHARLQFKDDYQFAV